MRYFSLWERVAFGGSTGCSEPPGEGERGGEEVSRVDVLENERMLVLAPGLVKESGDSAAESRVNGRSGLETRGTNARKTGIRRI